MAGYSRKEIIERMKEKNITLGWGAVCAFDRSRLNRVLEQQYLSRLHEHRYLPDFSGRFDAPEHYAAYTQLSMIEFGTPRLSFETASITDSRATLRMNIIGGNVATRSISDDGLLATFDISEGMGYSLTMDINLSLIRGLVDRRGTVSLDLAQGSKLSSDLLPDSLKSELERQLQAWFKSLPAHRTVFDLGIIDFHGYTPLTPTEFIIRTQAAPGAAFSRSQNYGDGAVLTFIQLAGNSGPGQAPGADFPYLIPDDKSGGDARYSATLVVAHDLLDHVEPGRLEVLSSLLFPGSQVFDKVDEETPHDLVVFGNIAPHVSSLTIEPSMVTLRPNGTQQFKLLDAKGKPLVAKQWSAVSLKSHLEGADGKIDGSGNYVAADASAVGHQTLTVVVTATYTKDKQDYQASARVFVMFDAVELAPRIQTQSQVTPLVSLVAGHASGNQVQWSLVGPEYGTLQASEAGASFTPGCTNGRLPIALQQLRAEQGEQTHAGILLLTALFPLPSSALATDGQRTTPGKRVKPGEQVQFAFPHDDFLPSATRRWRALGAGSVTENGLYQAASDVPNGADAVVCDLEHNGVTFNGAYRLLQLSELEEEGTWMSLQTYKVSQPALQKLVYPNGYQQLQIEIEVETVDVDGKNYRLSPKERASIVLVENKSSQQVKVLSDAEQGIEDPTLIYAARELRNVFKLSVGSGTAQEAIPSGTKAGKSIYKTLFLHLKDKTALATKFYASFTKDGGGEYRSIDKDEENGAVEVSPMSLPSLTKKSYALTGKRVKGAGDAEKEDDYNFNLRTRDYWSLSYLNGKFYTHEFINRNANWSEKKNVNTSMLRFENDHPNEVMASYTGFVFDDVFKPGRGSVASARAEKSETLNIEFNLKNDDEKTTLVNNPWGDAVDGTVFDSGTLVITNDRLDDVTYVAADQRKNLSQPMVVKLIDEYGNAHHLQFSYGPVADSGNRNTLEFTVVEPKS
ncbi:hypothetical protein [Pseudomonas putida]